MLQQRPLLTMQPLSPLWRTSTPMPTLRGGACYRHCTKAASTVAEALPATSSKKVNAMSGSMGPLLAADEFFNHQIVDTHATVLQTDLSWTEKVCGMVCAPDGSMSVNFGLGKYINRNVVDAYGGASCGVQQWTVRGSRRLSDAPNDVHVGPLHYDVIEPLQRVRVQLLANDVQPLRYDLELIGEMPCVVEEREDRRTLNGYRRTADQIRYHQIGRAQGWIELEGERIDVHDWVMTRDRSWGIRPSVGLPATDVEPDPMDAMAPQILALWSPVRFRAADGRTWGFFQYYLRYAGQGWRHERVQGGFEYPDGRRVRVRNIEPQLRFNPTNQRLLGGDIAITLEDGSTRHFRVEVLGDTGFHLGAGLYHGFEGQHHGQWRGPMHLEGEHFADCSTPDSVQRLNQFRDCLVALHDDAEHAIGIGNFQTWVQG